MNGPTHTESRVPALDGIRGIAILLVLFWHFYGCVSRPEWTQRLLPLEWIAVRGAAGVLLFFVLSGFLLGRILLRHRADPHYFRTFYIRRAARILPLYFVFIGTYAAMDHFFGAGKPPLEDLFSKGGIPFWSFIIFIQNISMARQGLPGPWLGTTWSLAIEEQFYLLLPVLLLVTPRRHVGAVALFLILLAVFLRFASLFFESVHPAVPGLLLPTQMDGFALGLLVANLVENKNLPTPRQARTWFFSFAMIYCAMSSLGAHFFGAANAALSALLPLAANALFASTILVFLCAPFGRIAQLVSNRPLVWIGRTSYFVYLFHLPVYYLIYALVNSAPAVSWINSVPFITICGLIGVFTLAGISYRYIETPLIRLGHRLAPWVSKPA